MDAAPPVSVPLPDRSSSTPWPGATWSEERRDGTWRRAVDAAGWQDLLQDRAGVGDTWALLLVQGGCIVAESYGTGRGPEDTVRSWSVAKSVLHGAVGVAAHEGLIARDDRVGAPEWEEHDARQAITVEHLLRMVPGLRWSEDYGAGSTTSDVQSMLFGEGKADMAAFAARKPLEHEPGTHFVYSSGTSNVLSRRLGHAVAGSSGSIAEHLRSRLFAPLGMSSATVRTDAAGTWIASSYLFATPRDLARVGLLYLRDGTWQGRRLLPEGWVDHARTLTPASGSERHGAHWWLRDDAYGTFQADGHRTQRLLVVPALDAVLVRIGDSEPGQAAAADAALGSVLDEVARLG